MKITTIGSIEKIVTLEFHILGTINGKPFEGQCLYDQQLFMPELPQLTEQELEQVTDWVDMNIVQKELI